MIHRTIPIWQTKSWQQELSELITQPEALFSLLELNSDLLPAARKAHRLFPLRTTLSYAQRIAKNKPDDPLLRQILPLDQEFIVDPQYIADPLQETQSTPLPGLIHKYRGRVLLIAANQCAINCRYCFRRHFDYRGNSPSKEQWQQSFAYIRQHDDIDEVILSGGDPLATADKRLAWLFSELNKIDHVSRLRIHTRLPIVAPSRVTEELLKLLDHKRLQTVVVVHCNHANEIDAEVAHTLRTLSNATTLLNQSVLLRGVNDNAQSMISLNKRLFSCGALPYYLHMLDKVAGTSHFAVTQAQALSINRALLANLPGYLVPKLVKEEPDAPSKTPII